MAYIPVDLIIGSWASPVTIVGSDFITNLDETVNEIVTDNANSLVNFTNTELSKLPAYLSAELVKINTDAQAATAASAAAALASQTAAASSETAAAASQASATASQASATASATSATASATSATASASGAAASAASSATDATATAADALATAESQAAAAASEIAAAASQAGAASSASSATTSATSATSSMNAANTSALAAATSQAAAGSSAAAAALSESNAAASQAAALASASAANGSAATATTQASAASASATAAASSAGTASTQAGIATTKATESAASATAAASSETAAAASAVTALSAIPRHKNLIMNSSFHIWQRGTTYTAGVWKNTADRWFSGGITSVSRHDDGQGTISLQIKADATQTQDTCYIGQHIEEWKHLIGQDITISFDYEVITAPTVPLRVGLGYRNISANNPSVSLDGTTSGRKTATIFTDATDVNWTRESMFLSLTFANNDYLSPASGGEVRFSNVQVETGNVATPYEPRTHGEELLLCQRYYQIATASSAFESMSTASAYASGIEITGLTPMRVYPTIDRSNLIYSSCTYTDEAFNTNGGMYQQRVNAAVDSLFRVYGTVAFSAEI